MLLAGQSLALGAMSLQSLNDLEAGLFGQDDLVNVTAAGSLIGRRKRVLVLADQLGTLGGLIRGGLDLLTEDDVSRAGCTHNRDLRLRPGKDGIRTEALAAHTDVRAAVRLAHDDGDQRHSGFAVGIEHLRAVADDAAVFLGSSGQEAGNIDEGDEQ